MTIYKKNSKFNRSYKKLTQQDKDLSVKKFKIFKKDPNDSRLDIYPIAYLTSLYKHPIYAIYIRGNLKVIFRKDGDIITTLDIGDHGVYESLNNDTVI